jgi:UDP-galactopyranose mutase
MEDKYDFLIVGAGPYGSVCARELTDGGKRCLVIDKRQHTGGNIFCDTIEGITVHTYGPHIFHTKDEWTWNYINRFVSFNHFINSPLANYKGRLFNLPFNMNTFYQLWGGKTPEEVKRKLKEETACYSHIKNPANLEEQALVLVGKEIYEKLIKGYS